jgi:hypothetical protein
MAGALVEAGAAEEAAGLTDYAFAIASSRDAPMRLTRCRSMDMLLKWQIQRFHAAPRRAPN